MRAEDTIRDAFERQARACEMLGSPFTARLCRLVASLVDHSGPVGRTILTWPGEPSSAGDSLPLRFAGALHALVLSGVDDGLKAAYPPNEARDGKLWDAVTEAMQKHATFIIDRLTSPPQTNEIRRSNALLPGFLTIADLFQKPLVLSEVGASMGLNLHWDRFGYDLGGFRWGDPGSPVKLSPDWHGNAPVSADIIVRDRRGCDLNPLDPHSAEDRLRLLSYIWADQTDRMERARAAIEIARANQTAVDKADALVWLKDRLSAPQAGAVQVVYHSIAWQYLPPAAREQGEEIITDAGSRATEDAPLARLQMEADDSSDGAAITLQIWPTGERHELGRADFHGRWIKWKGWG